MSGLYLIFDKLEVRDRCTHCKLSGITTHVNLICDLGERIFGTRRLRSFASLPCSFAILCFTRWQTPSVLTHCQLDINITLSFRTLLSDNRLIPSLHLFSHYKMLRPIKEFLKNKSVRFHLWSWILPII